MVGLLWRSVVFSSGSAQERGGREGAVWRVLAERWRTGHCYRQA